MPQRSLRVWDDAGKRKVRCTRKFRMELPGRQAVGGAVNSLLWEGSFHCWHIPCVACAAVRTGGSAEPSAIFGVVSVCFGAVGRRKDDEYPVCSRAARL